MKELSAVNKSTLYRLTGISQFALLGIINFLSTEDFFAHWNLISTFQIGYQKISTRVKFFKINVLKSLQSLFLLSLFTAHCLTASLETFVLISGMLSISRTWYIFFKYYGKSLRWVSKLLIYVFNLYRFSQTTRNLFLVCIAKWLRIKYS